MEIATVDHSRLLKHRVYAFTFDMFMVALTSKLVMMTYTSFMKTFFYQLHFAVQESLVNKLPMVHASVLLTVFFSYFFLSFYTSEGKTLGMTMFGLRVYSPTHPKIILSAGECLRRTCGYLVCYVTGLVLFGLPFVRNDRRGLPDIFSQTEVTFEDYFETLLDQTDTTEKDQLDLFKEAA